MTSLHVICGLGPPPIKNPGYAYVLSCEYLTYIFRASLLRICSNMAADVCDVIVVF